MEIAKGYTTIVQFPIPDDVECLVTIEKTGTTIAPFSVTPESGANVVEVPLPYAAVHDEGTIKVSLTFSIDSIAYTKTRELKIVTPYLDLWELKQIIGPNATDEECWTVEFAVRSVIDAFTGQSFGVEEGTITIMGNKNSALGFTRPCLRLDKILEGTEVRYDVTDIHGDSFFGEGTYTVTGDGWFLKRPSWDTDDFRTNYGDAYYTVNPITPPTFRSNLFRNDVVYTVTGRFGYEEVPLAIREAAKLLVNDYACADAMYRDRYLKSVRSADWRIEFVDSAFLATGNARADLLLGPYVVNRMLVI